MLVVKVNKRNDFGNFRKIPRFAPNVSVEIRMHQRPGLNTVPDNDRLCTMEPRLQLKRSPSLGIKLSRNPARSTDQR